jgi:hypothetical protein
MKGQRPITTIKMFSAQSIAASESATSVVVDLREIAQEGYFSVYATVAGSGALKLEYLVAPGKDGAFIEPAAASDIATGLTAGNAAASFSPVLSPFMKMKAPETGGAQGVVLSLWLNAQ